jgi:hypothetical protein
MAMTRRRALTTAVIVGVGAIGLWLLFVAAPGWWANPPAILESAQSTGPATARHIKATLFFLSDDGWRLQPIEREVLYGEGPLEQARRILEAQLEVPPPPLVSAIPAGTRLRAVFLTDRGDAYVDLSHEISSGHPGGSLNEILTVYTLVQALTTSLPAVTAVQILVDGHAVDTLAGHVDLRRPLPPNRAWVRSANEPAPAPHAPAPPGRP